MNNVILIGRLTKDPESRVIASSEKTVTNFTVAVDRPFAKEKTADFLRVVTFGRTAENCSRYLSKGQLVGVSGRIQTGSYETQSGEKRYTTEIIADRVEFLESKDKGRSDSGNNYSSNDGDALPDGFQTLDDDDEIPF